MVTDKKCKAITRLTQDHFRVFENDVPQAIVNFEPPPPSPAPTPEASVPALPGAAVPARSSPRFLILVFDQANLEPPALREGVKAAAEYVEKRLTAGDFVSLYAVGAAVRSLVRYTQYRQAIVQGIRSLAVQGNSGIPKATSRAQA